MSNEGLTDEQRSLIEFKRRKALENRSKHKTLVSQPSVTLVSNLPNEVVRLQQSRSAAAPNVQKPTSSQNARSALQPPSSRVLEATNSNAIITPISCFLSSRTTFGLRAPYHAGLAALCKTLPTRQYDPATKMWSFNLSDYHEFAKQIKSMGGIALDGLPDAVLKTFKPYFSKMSRPNLKSHDIRLCDFLPEDLVALLLPFQKDGIRLALSRSGRILLADDMGLGKTVQALALAMAYRSDWPMLVVCPSSVRFSWRDHCIKWMCGRLPQFTAADMTVVTSSRDLDGVNQYTCKSVTIISYDLMARHSSQLKDCNFGIVVMDESHLLKNNKTARTKAAVPLMRAAKRVFLLSGTPALSRPAELYPQISGVAPNLFKSGFHEFGLRYCAAKECPWGWDYSGCSNMTELQLILEESIMIRRFKSDVLSQLPPKRRELVVLDPNAIKAGRLKRHAKMLNTSNLPSEARREAMLQYFHDTASVKLPALSQYVLDLIEVGRKFILFAHHMEVLDGIANILVEKSVDFIRIDGRTNSEQRTIVCKKFQEEDDCLVALLSITAAGSGVNLTAANLVVFAELFWNPGMLVQAEDRAYRIGQQDSVLVRYLLAEGTADEYIWSLIEKKLDVLSKAGLNRETFRTADTTRLGNTQIQQSIMDFMESEFRSDTDTDAVLAAIPIPQPMVEASPVFEQKSEIRPNSPPAKRPKTTNLFAEHAASHISPAPDVLQCSGRLLVSATPESSPVKAVPGDADDDEVVETTMMEGDDTLLVEAAMAAEVGWLTENLLTDADTENFF